MTYRLYRTPIPEESLTEGNEQSRAKLSTLGLLDGSSAVESVSGSPADVTLNLQYRRRYAGRLGLELSELMESQTLQALPLAPASVDSEIDGYYAVELTEVGRVAPQTDSVIEIRGGLTKEGTRSSHRRAVTTRMTQPDPGNLFGNDLTALVGAPSEATRVRWWDQSFTQSDTATVVDTVQARFGDVDLYDARDVSSTLGDSPVLVYDLDYDSQGDVDVGVWDTYGEENPLDTDDVVQWGRVFDDAHDPRVDDVLVVENGLVRLWLDPTDGITAERWRPTADRGLAGSRYASDTGAGGIIYASDQGRGGSLYAAGRGPWDPIDLVDSGWSLAEFDITRIGAAAIDAQITFGDGSGSDYALDVRLERGHERPQWFVPETETDPVPPGLEDRLEPIANESVYHTGASLGLVARRELRR